MRSRSTRSSRVAARGANHATAKRIGRKIRAPELLAISRMTTLATAHARAIASGPPALLVRRPALKEGHIERAARARREARLPAKLDRQRRADEIAPGLEDDLTIAGRLPHASFEREEIASTISVTEPEPETLGHRREDERRMLRRSRDHGAGDVLRDLRILGRVLEGAGQEAQDGLRSLGGRDSPHLGTFDRIGAKGTERR